MQKQKKKHGINTQDQRILNRAAWAQRSLGMAMPHGPHRQAEHATETLPPSATHRMAALCRRISTQTPKLQLIQAKMWMEWKSSPILTPGTTTPICTTTSSGQSTRWATPYGWGATPTGHGCGAPRVERTRTHQFGTWPKYVVAKATEPKSCYSCRAESQNSRLSTRRAPPKKIHSRVS